MVKIHFQEYNICFYFYSLEELLTTQCDRFTAEEVSWILINGVC